MPNSTIRPVAVCVCRDGGRFLVEHGYDRAKQAEFYRAIGGGIEFGERAADAARREWMEEMEVDLDDIRLLGVLENLFTYEGCPGHEIVFVFTGRPRDLSLNSEAPLELIESNGQRHKATWVRLADLEAGTVALYPDGILNLLRKTAG